MGYVIFYKSVEIMCKNRKNENTKINWYNPLKKHSAHFFINRYQIFFFSECRESNSLYFLLFGLLEITE